MLLELLLSAAPLIETSESVPSTPLLHSKAA